MIKRVHKTLFQESYAHFSDCDNYRYLLCRTWDEAKPAICYLMLNPSTADEKVNDNTIELCQRRAAVMGYGSMIIVNIFPYRLTDSRQLNKVPDLIGDPELANREIVYAVARADMTICGWGRHKLAAPRAKEIMQLLESEGLQHKIYCLRTTKDGSPQHPLYIGYSVQPKPWRPQ